MTAAVDILFIDRTLKTTGIVALVILAFGSLYFDIFKILSLFSGIIWGIINLYFLALLVQAAVRAEGPDKVTVIALMFVKFPMLYFSGYCLLKVEQFNLYYLLAGFSLLFAVMVLKVLGRVLLGLDSNKANFDNQRQEAV